MVNTCLDKRSGDMIYLCKAYEQQYQGLHGMYELAIFCAYNKQSAIMDAINLSYEVMNSYDCITETIEKEYQELLEMGKDSDIYELYDDNVAFELYEVHTDKEFEEVKNDLDYLGYEDFIKEYECVEV